MIITGEKKDVEVGGDFQTQQFSILASAKAFDILTSKIYTNKVKAVIRELSTNAWDSHQDAGNPDTFDVHLPTQLEPWFSVRDCGTGISHEQMMTLYTEFFRSTRTDSNDFCGALGIGRMAPLCMVDSFTVTSWYNGEKRVYSAYKDENDTPQFCMLTEEDSDEPNGIEVSLAVASHQFHEFETEAVNVYSFFDQIPNINIKSVKEKAEQALEKYTIRNKDFATNTEWGNITCVMGNVGYKIGRYDISHSLSDLDIVLFFDIGELNFTPGRETLSFDEKTKKAVLAKLDAVKEVIVEQIQKQIEDQPNFYEAKKLHDSISRSFKSDYTYKGESLKFPPTFDEPVPCYYKESYGKSVKKMDVEIPYYDKNTEYFWNKTGYVGRIRNYLKSFYTKNRRIVLVEPEHLKVIGIDASYVQNLDDLEKVETASTGRVVDKCKIYTFRGTDSYKKSNNWDETTVDLNDGVERVYVEINRYDVTGQKWFCNSAYHINDTLKELKPHIGDVEVYGVKTVQTKAKGFKNGKWIKLDDYLVREMKKVAPQGIDSFTKDRSLANLICHLADHATDPIFEEFKGVLKKCGDRSLIRIIDNLGIGTEITSKADELYDKIMESHPILTLVRSGVAMDNIDKVALYV